MAIDVATLAGGALGGAIAQSILTPWFAQRHERRDLRAGVVRGLSGVERTRWAPGGKEKFRQALTDLRTAALVGGVNRALVDQYILFACAGRHFSDRSYERNPDPEFGGAINTEIAELIGNGAAAVIDFTWHPWLRRVTTRWVLNKLNRRKIEVTEALAQEGSSIDWTSVWVPS